MDSLPRARLRGQSEPPTSAAQQAWTDATLVSREPVTSPGEKASFSLGT